MIIVVGTILPAKGLTAESLKECTLILEKLCRHATFNGPLLLIPEYLALSLQSTHGKVMKKDVISLLKEINIDPARPVEDEKDS